MKYAFLFLASLLLNSPSLYAHPINSFDESQAIVNISHFMVDSTEDMPVSVRISDKKLSIADVSTCKDVAASDVVNEVSLAIKNVLRFYPDEELPIEDALNDLADYLGTETYKKCIFLQNNTHQNLRAAYFFNSKNIKHVKKSD